MNMEIKELTELVVKFRNARNWDRTQDYKDFAMALIAEAAEVVEHFKWHTPEQMKQYVAIHKDGIGDELSDVLFWVLLMSHDLDIDIVEAYKKKMKKNALKYPIKEEK